MELQFASSIGDNADAVDYNQWFRDLPPQQTGGNATKDQFPPGQLVNREFAGVGNLATHWRHASMRTFGVSIAAIIVVATSTVVSYSQSDVASKAEAPKPDSVLWNPARSPKTNDLAISDTSKSVSVHSVVDGSLRFRIPNLPSSVLRLEWSPSGDSLVIGGHDGMLRICNVSEPAVTKALDAGSDKVYSLACSRSGDRLAPPNML